MTTSQPVILSDEQVAGIAARPIRAVQMGTPLIELTVAERDALCRTVRALREKHTQLTEVSGEWASLLDRIRLWSKCADGYPLDEHINNITTRLAQVEKERNELRSELERKNYMSMFSDTHVGED